MATFKVGDRVRVVGAPDGSTPDEFLGKTATITFAMLHGYRGRIQEIVSTAKDGSMTLYPDELELIEEPAPDGA